MYANNYIGYIYIMAGRREMEVPKTVPEVVQYLLKVACEKLKMYTINTKATTKIIHKEGNLHDKNTQQTRNRRELP